jgi:hypothetical protein
MSESHQESIAALQDIKRIMNQSSRFISLSGLSGISAGICALIGCWFAHPYIVGKKNYIINQDVALVQAMAKDYTIILNTYLFYIGLGTLIAAIISAFVFTFLKSKKDGIKIWGATSIRLLFNLGLPLLVAFIFVLKLLSIGAISLIMPSILIFYGLALMGSSKYTLGEIKYLGYCQILLGVINLFMVGYGIYFAAFGFGVLHIIYGVFMWLKYERN